MPLLPPVTSATFPSSFPIYFSLVEDHELRPVNSIDLLHERARAPVARRSGRTRRRARQPKRSSARTRQAPTERDEDIRDVAAPSQGQPATAGRDGEPRQICEQWPAQPPGALRGEVQRHAEPEETVERTDRAQIARAGGEHRRIRVEQREARVRE